MRLLHLALPVRNLGRSLAGYATCSGFDPAGAGSYPDGTTIVRNADGFDPAMGWQVAVYWEPAAG